jgi:hypothetical protein
MEKTSSSKTKAEIVFLVTHVLTWMAFIGLCIKTGAIAYSFLVSIFLNSEASKNLYEGLNLSSPLADSSFNYYALGTFILLISAMKAFIAYLGIKIFQVVDLNNPFSEKVSQLISRISHLAIFSGVVALLGSAFNEWLAKRNSDDYSLHDFFDSGTELLFLGLIIFLIAQVIKRGVAIQSENELTV